MAKENQKPVSCRYLGTRWDGVRHFYVKFEDGSVIDVWQSRAENPYDVDHLPIDESITLMS
jgi:hypothetical protein